MNCNDFKNKVADLFDKNIDMHTKTQMNEHMANCHECKAYYDELREAFSMLQPKEAANMSKAKTTHRLWHYAAAAAVFLLGFIIGWSHLFSTPAVADDTKLAFIRQSIQSVQNVGSFQMEVYARTTQQDNFAYFSPGLPRGESQRPHGCIRWPRTIYVDTQFALHQRKPRNQLLGAFHKLDVPRTAVGHAGIGHSAVEGEQCDSNGNRHYHSIDS